MGMLDAALLVETKREIYPPITAEVSVGLGGARWQYLSI